MKKIIFLISLIPILAAAHSGALDFNSVQGSQGMMRYMEDLSLGDSLHEEMEGLMVKMMNGRMTEFEANRLNDLMIQYPGPNSMMMNRLGGGMGRWNGAAMTSWMGFATFWSWLAFLGLAAWSFTGALAALWLWRKYKN
ncbi:MAG: hypothetical protein A3I89_02735 [Candidatus Harrisonbacteria bacterium RIFCSPLOWO2_02_FULL_41_11]|uniref:Uncharacterized protein n=1 Tax=Candidatus Harrisonbacteria bacterium RIFCSPHIGHO2_02_FULL_42_16 TaxID=1798404 RepID=A0A1G1ZL87_9BACT|nr:MAG: hypothetical protein A3B92_00445 [Candidatus Harrisonbacteria bacterium RIFCSPHIGHO2_02_FULL_42_16]OGY66576.1 MAG: hypothetical protein A3I89_02735 [Candidatus Harrisonbacteria bacterium RIFCSPLOWO2_02_FULL_41_11]